MPKFTEGEWEATQDRHLQLFVCDKNDHDKVICEVLTHNGDDAKLIAAAPDLYEELEKQLNNWIELIESGDAGFWDKESDKHVISMRAALAKARGEK